MRMPKPKLGLDLNLDDSDSKLTVNKEYAKNYTEWRKKEELQKFKNKYGTDDLDELEAEDSDSASSVESVKWTADDERDFLRTLGALKSKDPKIYQSDVKFFHEREEEESDDEQQPKELKAKKEKPMRLRDYEQKLVIERGGQLSDDDDVNKNDPSYVEREAQLKQDLKNALNDFSADEDEESDGLLKPRVKTTEERKAEEDEYYDWLKGHRQDVANVDEDLKSLKKSWDTPKLDDGERFLRDYILNKQYETDANPAAIGDEFCPTYDEIVQEDEEEEKRDEFEVKYNFRYEEPDQDFIKQFPRTVAESIRKSDTRRKEARERKKQRTDEEKRERDEEIRQIKAIQKAEAEKKLKKLKQIAGEDQDLALNVEDLQKDFDPEEHDRMMKQIEEEIDEENGDELLEPTTSSSAKKSELEFRYRKVEPGTYGLTTDEILKLDDRQLNAWVSMKKITAYRSNNAEHAEQRVYEQKAKNVEKKKKVFASIPPKMPKASKMKAEESKPAISSEPLNDKKKRHRKRKSTVDLDAQRLHAYGVSTRKLKTELHKKKKMSK